MRAKLMAPCPSARNATCAERNRRTRSEFSRSNERANQISTDEYATADDFQRCFASEMTDLFRLAFLLTANAGNAEHCLILAMRECMSNGSVSKQWVRAWARRVVIRNGVKLVTGIPDVSLGDIQQTEPSPSIDNSHQIAFDAFDESLEILELSDFKRLVYVLCVLEKYGVPDCALLLGRPQQEVRNALTLASAQIMMDDQKWRRFNTSDSTCFSSTPECNRGELDNDCGTLLD